MTISPNPLVNATRQKDARTYNNAVTNSTSLNNVVDLFFVAGASRNMSVSDIERMLQRSWTEDALLTLKLIFWAGNVRGGAGERRFFRIALHWLETNYNDSLTKNYKLVPQYTRWDNLFHLKFETVADFLWETLTERYEGFGLLAKWMPRRKQYGNFADKFRKYFKLDHRQYRRLIVDLSKTVEQQMCRNDWEGIKYSAVPSVAMHKYRTAFFRHDQTRFEQFIHKVKTGEEKINAGVLFPYQLYQSAQRGENKDAIEAQWYAMPDYLEGNDERILPVCDVSGSMSGLPMAISVSLGLYLSERNKSIFKDAFITFSGSPKMEYLKGSVIQRMQQLETAHWDSNTDLNKVFELILNRAVSESISESDMPTMILIISDMEFDDCGNLTNYKNIKNKYEQAGYKIPKILFWNVNGRAGNVPVQAKEPNVALVSGATPAVIKGVLAGKSFTPADIMLEVLNNEVYDKVTL